LGINKGLFIVALVLIVLVILVVPVFPRDTVVMVNGTTQTIVNSASITTQVQVSTVSTNSQMSVYTGSFQYYTQSQIYQYYPQWGGGWNGGNGGSNCQVTKSGLIICNWNGGWNGGWGGGWNGGGYTPWQTGTTVTVTPQMQVVNVISSTGYNGLESLTLVYSNGQQSQPYSNVYNDQLQSGGTYSVPSIGTVTNTVTNTVMVPVNETVPCTGCVPTHVTEYVSLLQLIFGF
jgi:hypothetical protein